MLAFGLPSLVALVLVNRRRFPAAPTANGLRVPSRPAARWAGSTGGGPVPGPGPPGVGVGVGVGAGGAAAVPVSTTVAGEPGSSLARLSVAACAPPWTGTRRTRTVHAE